MSSLRPIKEEFTILNLAKDVLSKEIKGLELLSNSLDGQFVNAVECLSRTQGKILTTGMGKSGHVAQKVASTLSSLGCPSFYIHPGEAIHGDLGAISSNDSLIAFSFSGNTSELKPIIHFASKNAIPLIGMTRNSKSFLATNASYSLNLPDAPEACALGAAPTTSTTMMMALGDALAVSLSTQRGLTKQQYQVFHPGGQLGIDLSPVSFYMHQNDRLPLIHKDTLMKDALIEMSEKGFGTVGVRDESGSLVGIITDGDLRRHMSDHLLMQYAYEIMTPSPYTLEQTTLMKDVFEFIRQKHINSIFIVTSEAKPVGFLHLHDFLKFYS